VPDSVVTVTGTVPDPAGAVATISSADTTVAAVARTVPKRTVAGAAKLLPVMVTTVPAAPVAGLRPVTAGAGSGTGTTTTPVPPPTEPRAAAANAVPVNSPIVGAVPLAWRLALTHPPAYACGETAAHALPFHQYRMSLAVTPHCRRVRV
jgi:hypothetical protein